MDNSVYIAPEQGRKAMYKHVREVKSGLVLSLVLWAIMAAVAIIDPWGNGVPWANWITISAICTISVATATICTAEATDETKFWGFNFGALCTWLVFAGLVVGLMFTGKGGLDPAYHSLAWSFYAVPFVVLPISALVQYLVGASAQTASEQSHLRRVA